ncbi:ABC ATP-binding domain-containing protein [Cyclospora cayetanensis]|uniref:ABC ATP-binding domain-containing protein n=1 Tax=Cyclospora cayetanensis TaxID=88456 RepID=A0A1D3D7P9_9EIME|nr:ABC ATP-binding domain-containing protein [Cyclospora cayetanensis]
METAIRCAALYHAYSTPRKGVLNVPSCAPSTLLSDALEVAASQQPKRRKGEAGSLLGETAHAQPFCLQNITLEIPVGARVLLVGSNGAGKSTLLALMGGQMMTQTGELLIFGRRAFDDSSLANEVCCLNTWWTGDYVMEVRLEEILAPSLRHSSCWEAGSKAHRGSPPTCSCGKRFLCTAWRIAVLLRLLQVDPAWRMGFVSAGERRRAQLVASLAERRRVYLLDEPTGELDVVSPFEWGARQGRVAWTDGGTGGGEGGKAGAASGGTALGYHSG